MHKIIEGVRNFHKTAFVPQRTFFENLAAKQQTPLALFVTCSDSRLNPNLITQTDPGDLFILRNAGNIVPPYGAAGGGEGATIEYAINVLGLKNIIICGHHHCGAMKSLLSPQPLDDLPAVKGWFSHAEATKRIMRDKYPSMSNGTRQERCVEQNVLVQIDNLRTHPSVATGLARGEIHIYGWVYKIETGEVFAYDPARGAFVSLVDDHEVLVRPMPASASLPAAPPVTFDCA